MISCAIVGATGLVGSAFLKILEERTLPIDRYVLFASSKSSGKKIRFMNKEYVVEELNENSPDQKFDYALFSAGGNISKKYAPLFVKNKTTVIDNSSFFRMHKNVPLIVPEVNFNSALKNSDSTIISNPNCSTIQAMLPLKILDDKYTLIRVTFATYQACSRSWK